MVTDLQDKEFALGDKVVRMCSDSPNNTWLEIHEVTKINDDKIYLNGSRMPMKFPARICILNRKEDEHAWSADCHCMLCTC